MGSEPVIVLDTHALLWWVDGGNKLSKAAAKATRLALRKGPLVASVISILEIATAVRRGRLRLSVPTEAWLQDVRGLPEVRIEPVTFEIARTAGVWGEEVPGDPADRLIAATALSLGASLVTADRNLARARIVPTVW